MTIHINTGHPMVTKTKGRENRYPIVCGMFTHELGHVLYTDFLLPQTQTNYMERGLWYPEPPVLHAAEDLANKKALWAYVKADPKNLEAAKEVSHFISNVLEDGYIENRMLKDFPGTLGFGLTVLREKMWEEMGAVTDLKQYEDDGSCHIFQSILKVMLPELAVGLLVDESGSMCSGDRCTYARAAAIILHDFCDSLDIPIMVYGHSTDGRGVALYSYAEFDGFDSDDRYWLMDIGARSNNRDGAALRFVAERLSKRPEAVKLLILVSDGQPADTGYDGTAAEEDLRGIKQGVSKCQPVKTNSSPRSRTSPLCWDTTRTRPKRASGSADGSKTSAWSHWTPTHRSIQISPTSPPASAVRR